MILIEEIQSLTEGQYKRYPHVSMEADSLEARIEILMVLLLLP